jgi:hypothetical protein
MQMEMIKQYRHSLYKGSKKWKCPGCGQLTLVRYQDNETKELLPEDIGRCDRENSCGFHRTPKEYFSETGNKRDQVFIEIVPIAPAKIDNLPSEYLERCMDKKFHSRNNFYQYINSLFGENVAIDLFSKYCIGTSSYWKGAVMFPQLDQEGELRQIKVMLHDPKTGKRIKKGALVERWDKQTKTYVSEVTEKDCAKIIGQYLNEYTQSLNLEQTFFGSHLLAEDKTSGVCICESEKTALIASVYMPQFIWLATGGASGVKWREYGVYKILKGRSVTMFPDYGFFNKQSGKTCYQEWCERAERIKEALQWNKIRVSDVLEKRLAHLERQDQDLADMLLNRDFQTGVALEEAGYPIAWDYKFYM